MSDARKIQEGAEWTPDDYGTDADYRATPSGPPERARPLSGIERTERGRRVDARRLRDRRRIQGHPVRSAGASAAHLWD